MPRARKYLMTTELDAKNWKSVEGTRSKLQKLSYYLYI
jgi:hypothetical protein